MNEKRQEVRIVKQIAVLREGKNGWTQELNLVSWYGQPPKYDIRWWSKDKTESGKGITLRPDELGALKDAIVYLPDNLHLIWQENIERNR